MRLDVVVADIDRQQTERGDVTRIERDENVFQTQDVDETAGEQGAGAAERHEGEVANVEATLDGDLTQGVGLVPRRDLEDADRALLEAQTELCCKLFEALACQFRVERNLATE